MTNFNENNIREAAYYNWQNAGCPSGKDEYFWNMAVKQLYGTATCKKTSSSKAKTAKAKTSTKTVSDKMPAKSAAKKNNEKIIFINP